MYDGSSGAAWQQPSRRYDLLLGVCLVLALAVTLSPLFVLWSAAILFVAHQLLTAAGFALGMRATRP
jgi:hypothetical protein